MTVIELLVSVSVMTVIVYGLYALFNHTQKALRANITQVDVLESGRAAMEMLTREMVELTASRRSNTISLRATMSPVDATVLLDLDEKTPLKTNLLQEVFFLTALNNDWNGTGYRVMEPVGGVGTLYRYTISTNALYVGNDNLLNRFDTTGIDPVTKRVSTNLHRVADGVIHLRFAAYDHAGRMLNVGADRRPNALVPPAFRDRLIPQLNPSEGPNRFPGADIQVRRTGSVRDPRYQQTEFFFQSNALPAYVEVELGILEPEAFRQFQSIRDSGDAAFVQNFLRKRANKIHLFRQRVPIRTAVP